MIENFFLHHIICVTEGKKISLPPNFTHLRTMTLEKDPLQVSEAYQNFHVPLEYGLTELGIAVNAKDKTTSNRRPQRELVEFVTTDPSSLILTAVIKSFFVNCGFLAIPYDTVTQT